MKKILVPLFIIFALVQFSIAEEDIVISNAWVREVPPGTSVSAGYMTIQNNGSEDDRLLGMTSYIAESAELHRSNVDENGVATMEKIEILELPKGDSVALDPGGMHIMLIGLKESLVGKDSVKLTLKFEKSEDISLEVPVKSGMNPASHHHHH